MVVSNHLPVLRPDLLAGTGPDFVLMGPNRFAAETPRVCPWLYFFLDLGCYLECHAIAVAKRIRPATTSDQTEAAVELPSSPLQQKVAVAYPQSTPADPGPPFAEPVVLQLVAESAVGQRAEFAVGQRAEFAIGQRAEFVAGIVAQSEAVQKN